MPSFEVARRVKAREAGLPDGAFPCTSCWGKGCAECERKGVGSRGDFALWYSRLRRERERRLAEWEAAQDRAKKNIVGRDYYDLALLRSLGRSG